MDERERIIAKLKAIEYTFAKAKSGDFWSYCLYWNRDFFIKRKFLKEVVDVLQLVHDGYKNGKVIRSERYTGSCSRKFYVGEGYKEEDFTAKFENGELMITFPKTEPEKIEEKKPIMIE